MKEKRIGFVGVGRMGSNMARHLKDAGYNVSAVFDVNKDAQKEVADELGAVSAESLGDVSANSDVVVTVVTDDDAMRGIFTGDDSLLKDAAGKVFINCATVSPAVHLEVEEAAQAAGAQSLEGCMASSISQAREGTLYLMVAGEKDAFDAVKPLLEEMSVNMRHTGPTGSAAKVKALVNMVMNINTAGLAEGLGLGAALGIDLEMLCEVFSQTGANSRVLETDAEDMLARDHECWFSSSHAAKDSGIAVDLAKDVGLNLPLAVASRDQYELMKTKGLGELDKSGIAELTFIDRNPG